MVKLSKSRDELVAWFEAGCKPAGPFGSARSTRRSRSIAPITRPFPTAASNGIRALLEGMRARLGWERIEDGGNLIGLYDANGGGAISLEPGGQFELSGAPLDDAHETAEELERHLAACRTVAGPLGIGFLTLGMSPKWTLAETPVMPKSRYAIMARYMPKVGTRGLDMMFRTATVQANLDFASEADMVAKLRVGLALQPVITALFANSPFTDGKPNGLLSARSEIWRDTDPARTGMLPFAFEPGMGFERYVDYALDVPLYFVKRGDHYHDVAGASFRDLLAGRLRSAGRARDDLRLGQPSLDDFPRGAAQALSRNARRRCRAARAHRRAVGADGRPLLRYGRAAGGRGLIEGWSAEERQKLRDDAPLLGLAARFAAAICVRSRATCWRSPAAA